MNDGMQDTENANASAWDSGLDGDESKHATSILRQVYDQFRDGHMDYLEAEKKSAISLLRVAPAYKVLDFAASYLHYAAAIAAGDGSAEAIRLSRPDWMEEGDEWEPVYAGDGSPKDMKLKIDAIFDCLATVFPIVAQEVVRTALANADYKASAAAVATASDAAGAATPTP